jgi:ABC-2 type transport system permease protein
VSRLGRIGAEARAAWHSFLRRRTAVFFTFFFPIILVVIFGALVRTDPTGGGLFAEPPGYYAAGYVAVVVVFTPLSRVGSEVARTREGRRFEKLATTPLTRAEWLLAHTAVNGLIIALAALAVLALVVALTGAAVAPSPLLVPLVAAGVALFCGVGATLGALADSRDGAISASNAVGLPLLFLSETFVPPSLLPTWFRPVVEASPLTYFSRGARAATFTGNVDAALANLAILAALAVVAFAVGAALVPRTE